MTPTWKSPAGALLAGAVLLTAAATVCAQERSGPEIAKDGGFAWIDGDDTIPHRVERKVVEKGIAKDGHPIDALKSIDTPRFYASHDEAAKHLGLRDDDRVLGVAVGKDARAYPTRILDRHEIVNDTIGGRPLAVVW